MKEPVKQSKESPGTLGAQLLAAREAMGVTASQAAAATRIKVQHIEALEHDDYRRLNVPIYAKGFIRIYGEYLGLDVEALVAEYHRANVQEDDAAPLPSKVLHGMGQDVVPPLPVGVSDGAAAADRWSAWLKGIQALLQAMPSLRGLPTKVLGFMGAALLVVLLLVVGGRMACRSSTVSAPSEGPSWVTSVPEPYLDQGR